LTGLLGRLGGYKDVGGRVPSWRSLMLADFKTR